MLPRVVFHHVHKCAGTTLLKYLQGTASPERSAFVESLVGTSDPHGVDRLAAILRAGEDDILLTERVTVSVKANNVNLLVCHFPLSFFKNTAHSVR